MKKKQIFLIAAAILLIVVIGLAIKFLFFNSKQTNETKVSPQLELTLISKPDSVNTICEDVYFKISARNTGNVEIKYDEIISGEYAFITYKEPNYQVFLYTQRKGTNTKSLEVSDFGSIKPGETKEITLQAKVVTTAGNTVYIDNGFNMLQNSGNGNFQFTMEFDTAEGEFTYILSSNKVTFEMGINAFEKTGDTWINKACDL